MRRRPLGTTGLEVSEVGFGCAGFWARPLFSREVAVDLVRRAIDHGVTFFDTGASYGRGESERRLGEALRGRWKERLIVATKAGTMVGRAGRLYKDFRPEAIRRSVEGSLRRLGTERITLLHLHHPRAEDLSDELVEALEELMRSGLVGFCGINSYGPELVRLALEREAFSTMMFDYSLLYTDRKTDIDRLVESGRGFIASTPLAQGHFRRLTLLPRRAADLWYLARALGRHRDAMQRGRSFRFVDDYEGWSGAQVALAYVLNNPRVSTAVCGTTRAVNLDANVAVTERALPAEIIDRIEAV